MFTSIRYFLFSTRGPRFWVFAIIILAFGYFLGNPFEESTSKNLNFYAEEVLSFLFFVAILLPLCIAVVYYSIVMFIRTVRRRKNYHDLKDFDSEIDQILERDDSTDDD